MKSIDVHVRLDGKTMAAIRVAWNRALGRPSALLPACGCQTCTRSTP